MRDWAIISSMANVTQDVSCAGQAGATASRVEGRGRSARVTEAMIQAGAERLVEVLGCGGPTYVAEQVFLAMADAEFD
jgi:hypothetical protein